jgi:hypothetical protein
MGQRIGRGIVREEAAPLGNVPVAWLLRRWTRLLENHRAEGGFLISPAEFVEALLPLHETLYFNYRSSTTAEEDRQKCLFEYKAELRKCVKIFDNGTGASSPKGSSAASPAAAAAAAAKNASPKSAAAKKATSDGERLSTTPCIHAKEVMVAALLMSSSSAQAKMSSLLRVLFEGSPRVNATELEIMLGVVLRAVARIDAQPECSREDAAELAVLLTDRIYRAAARNRVCVVVVVG